MTLFHNFKILLKYPMFIGVSNIATRFNSNFSYVLTHPSIFELEEALERLHNLSSFRSYDDESQSLSLKMECLLKKDKLDR